MTSFSKPMAAAVMAFSVGIALLAVSPRSLAQSASFQFGAGLVVHADAAKVVDPPNVPMSLAEMFKTPSPSVRPTMSPEAYAAAKLAASSHKGSKLVGPATVRPDDAGSVFKFKGLDESGSSDNGATSTVSSCSGAIGLTQYAEVTNDAFAVYNRAGTLLKTTPLSDLFNYTAEPLFDPVVRYDPLWNRWIVTATGMPENATTQYLEMAVSKSGNAEGEFWESTANVAFHSGDNWDYEKTGLTQDAVLFDANVYNGGTYSGATFFSISKALLYNGHEWDVPAAVGLNGTLALPIVMDPEPNTYLMYTVPGTSNIGVYTVTNAADGLYGESVTGPVLVSAPDTSFDVPPPASQPGTKCTLDTLDTRFLNNTIQLNGTIYGVDCVASSGGVFPECLAVLVNYAASPITVEVEPFYAWYTSDDFNPSISVDYSGDLAVQWNSTDTDNGQNVSIYANAASAGSTLSYPGGEKVMISTLHYGTGNKVQPWGACSSLTLDPVDQTTWWGTNQLIETGSTWKTENFNFVTAP